jgi:hypothetical protein
VKSFALQFEQRQAILSYQRNQLAQLIHVNRLLEMSRLRRSMSPPATVAVAVAALRRVLRRRNYLGGFVVLFGHDPLCSGRHRTSSGRSRLLIPVALFN